MARLAYLLAASHSGSTLLAMLLGAQRGACTVGELKLTSLGRSDTYRCSCRKLIHECEFWRKIGDEMGRRGFSGFDLAKAGTSIFEVPSRYAQRLLAPLHRGPALELVRDAALSLSPQWQAHRRETDRRNKALVDSVIAATGARVVIDSSKVALRLKYLLRNPALEIKVIRTVRDGRAVAMTYMDEWNFADASDPSLRSGGTGEKRLPPRRNMAEAANEWKRSQEASEALLARLPREQWMQVRYEDLCTNPEATLRAAGEFLGLDVSAVNLDFRSQPQHVVGNGMRLDSTSAIRLDERWKSHLSTEDLGVFEEIAGPLNRRYGYQ